MKMLRLGVLMYLSMLLSGCLYGQCMDGPCALERSKIIKSIKAYGEYWVKPGMSNANRSQDSINCGGSDRGPDFSTQQINTARQSDDKDDFAARTRLSKAWVECMQSKGYEYRR